VKKIKWKLVQDKKRSASNTIYNEKMEKEKSK
jgi:hypothetical protein